jgi:hypothetical protein
MSEHHESSHLLSPPSPPSTSASSHLNSIKIPPIVESLLVSRENTDSVVFSIINQFKQRADFGRQKYGTTLDRDDLSTKEWVQHAQEELMDAILYLEKLKSLL